MQIKAKICGLKTVEAIKTAQDNGAEFLGFIFAPDSPRYITPIEAGKIAKVATAKKVAVVVNADDEMLGNIVLNLKPDYIQLHGNESEIDARLIKDKFKIPLIRAIKPNEYYFQNMYDYILVDSHHGGGSGKTFDWMPRNFTPPSQPWFLSGGLNAGNIAEAIRTTGAEMVDVSSGVESARGVKSPELIAEFLNALKRID